MHILFIPAWFETPERPTAGKAVKDLAYALALEGIKVNFLFQSRAPLPLHSKLNHQIEVWHSRSGWPGKLFPIWNQVFLWSCLRVFKQYIQVHGIPDLIHIHSYPLLPLARVLYKKYGIRIVYTEHSSGIAQQKLSLPERWLLRTYMSDFIHPVAVSHFLKSGINAIVPEIPVSVIPNTIDFNYFKPGPKTDNPDLIMINLLNKNKQVDLGLKVFSAWIKLYPGARLHIIGDGPEKKNLEALAQSIGITEQLKWWGEKSAENWLSQLQSSACLLFLSRLETFGVVVLESLACEIPVVCLQNKGINDIPVGEVIPILPHEADESQIVKAMQQVIDRFKQGAGHKLRVDLRAQFDYPVVARQYITLYQNILNSEN